MILHSILWTLLPRCAMAVPPPRRAAPPLPPGAVVAVATPSSAGAPGGDRDFAVDQAMRLSAQVIALKAALDIERRKRMTGDREDALAAENEALARELASLRGAVDRLGGLERPPRERAHRNGLFAPRGLLLPRAHVRAPRARS